MEMKKKMSEGWMVIVSREMWRGERDGWSKGGGLETSVFKMGTVWEKELRPSSFRRRALIGYTKSTTGFTT